MSAPQNPQHLQFITKALRSGFNESQIAANLGITQSAVSQYIDAHGLADDLKQNKTTRDVDANLNDIELMVTERIKAGLRFAPVSVMQLGNLLRTVNGAKRRSLGNEAQASGDDRLVALRLPQHIQISINVNAQNELIEVDGRTLTSLPSGQLLEEAMRPVVRKPILIEAQEDLTYGI